MYLQLRGVDLKRHKRNTRSNPGRFSLLIGLGILAASVQSYADINYRVDASKYSRLAPEVTETIQLVNRSESAAERRKHLDHLRSLADLGSADAAFELGYASLKGLAGLSKNTEQGVELLEQAVRQEESFMLLAYGLLLLSGEYVTLDTERGKALIQRAAELSSTHARVMLIDNMADTGLELSSEQRQAWRDSMRYNARTGSTIQSHSEVILEKNFAEAYAMLSHLYSTGTFVRQDKETASKLKERIAEKQRATALRWMAYFTSNTTRLWHDQRAALSYFESEIDDAPRTINGHAWLLATSVDSSVRDGARAVQLMEDLFAVVKERGVWVDTLAAAYAEAGRFELAVETQNRAIELLGPRSKDRQGAIERLNLYKEGKAWRD